MEAVILAPLGANPAPLIQLVWALHANWHIDARAVSVVVDARGDRYLKAEALRRGAAWDELKRALGAHALDRKQLRVVAARTDSGALLASDETPENAARYGETAWSAAREAIAAAGDDPVVFALVAGRRRTMHVAARILFQLLARPQDRLVDVRVSERWAENTRAFCFPGQQGPLASQRDRREREHDPSSVDVSLVDVQRAT